MDTLTKINFLLKKNKLNQKDLTDFLGIHKNSFTNWKNGGSSSYLRYLPQIAEFFNVSIDYLADKDVPDSPAVLSYNGSDPLKQEISNIMTDILDSTDDTNKLELLKNILIGFTK